MEVKIQITGTLDNSVFGNFTGKYFGENQTLRAFRECSSDITKPLNNEDDVIINTQAIKNNLEIGKVYILCVIPCITGKNINNNATLDVTKFISCVDSTI